MTKNISLPKLFDSNLFHDPQELFTNVLMASTEYSIIGTRLNGTILLWSEGSKRMLGYEPEETIGKMNISQILTSEDLKQGLYQEITETALNHNHWKGNVRTVRKNGEIFIAWVIVTPLVENNRPIGYLGIARDITQEINREEELQAAKIANAEQSYTRSLIESAPDAMIITDLLGNITDLNKPVMKIVTCSREEMIGKPFKNYSNDSKNSEDLIRQTLQNGQVLNFELNFKGCQNDLAMEVSCNTAILKNSKGKSIGIIINLRDISKFKNLERQLREEEIYNRNIIEAASDALATIDVSGIILDVNEQMCKMTGFLRQELIGSSYKDYIVDAQKARLGLEEVLKNEFVRDYILQGITRDKGLLDISFNGTLFRNSTGEVKGIFVTAQDITKQTELQKQLEENNAFHRAIIEKTLDGYFFVDSKMVIKDVNNNLCCLLGYDRDEVIGKEFAKFFDDPSQAIPFFLHVMEKGEVKHFELTLSGKNKLQKRVSLNSSIVQDSLGNITGLIACARDIEELTEFHKQIIEQKSYTRSIFEASPNALFVLIMDGTIFDVNQKTEQMTGFVRKHLINSKFSDYFTDPSKIEEFVKKLKEGDKIEDYQLELITHDKRKINVSFNANLINDPIRIIATARDITCQKELDRKFQNSRYYNRSLMESNIDLFLITDPLGIITDINQQAVKLLGLPQEEIIGTSFKTYFTSSKKAEEALRQVLQNRQISNYELKIIGKGGKETDISFNLTTFYDQDKKLQGIIASGRDMTYKKNFEAALREKNIELEQAIYSKDRFLATMSHELRTPLNSILGFTGALLMNLAGPLNEEQVKQLGIIKTNGSHLLSLIDDLLDLARLDSGKTEIHLEHIDLISVIKEIETSLRPSAEKKGLNFSVALPKKELMIMTDRRALTQIILNLTGNAIKFTDKGSVTLQLNKNSENGTIALDIIDTGMGIKKEDEGKLFQAFSKIDSRKKIEGTGLGLYLSKKLAILIQADIAFKSEFQNGSTFSLILKQ